MIRLLIFPPYLSEPATVLDNSDDVYIEPLQDSVLTYCELRGKRDYKRNYF